MKERAKLWYDVARTLMLDAEAEGNQERKGECANLACIVGGYLQEYECAEDEQEREELEYELRMAIEAVRPRVIELIADGESGGRHTIINQQNNGR